MDREFLDRLTRLREAHTVLAAELSAAQRALRDARNDVAGLRAQIERERHQQVTPRPVRVSNASRVY